MHTIRKKNITKKHPNHWRSACSGQAFEGNLYFILRLLRCKGKRHVCFYCTSTSENYCLTEKQPEPKEEPSDHQLSLQLFLWNLTIIYTFINTLSYSSSHSSTRRCITFIYTYPYVHVHPNLPTSNNSITISHLSAQNIFFSLNEVFLTNETELFFFGILILMLLRCDCHL